MAAMQTQLNIQTAFPPDETPFARSRAESRLQFIQSCSGTTTDEFNVEPIPIVQWIVQGNPTPSILLCYIVDLLAFTDRFPGPYITDKRTGHRTVKKPWSSNSSFGNGIAAVKRDEQRHCSLLHSLHRHQQLLLAASSSIFTDAAVMLLSIPIVGRGEHRIRELRVKKPNWKSNDCSYSPERN